MVILKTLRSQFFKLLIAGELFLNFLDQRFYLRSLNVSISNPRSWAKKFIEEKESCSNNFLRCVGMVNTEDVSKSRNDSTNLLTWFFTEDDYNSVSDIAAERSLTPSSSHLNCGAVAPAITAYQLQIKGR